MTTRTQVADYLATKLPVDRRANLRQAAAWLITNRRRYEAKYLARDMAAIQTGHGYVWARLTAARKLSPETVAAIEIYLRHATEAAELELELAVDHELIGGLHIETATAELDATVRADLNRLVAESKQ